MKHFMNVWSGLLLVLCLCMIPGLSGTEASEYLGDYCWNFANHTYGTTGTMQLGISWLGNGHYGINGTVIYDDSWFNVINGSGEVIGDTIHVNLFQADTDGVYAWNDIAYAEISLVTLNGSFHGIETWSHSSNFGQGMDYYTGTLYPAACR